MRRQMRNGLCEGTAQRKIEILRALCPLRLHSLLLLLLLASPHLEPERAR